MHNNEYDIRRNMVRFLRYLKENKHVPMNTYNAHKFDLLNWYKFFQSKHNSFQVKHIDDLSIKIIERFVVNKRQQKMKSTSIARHLSSIRSFYLYLNKLGLTDKNPAKLVQPPKKPKRLPKILNKEQASTLMDSNKHKQIWLNIRDRAMLEALYSTGMRISELANLTINNLNLDENTAKILGKGNKERFVVLGDYAVKSLNIWLNIRNTLPATGKQFQDSGFVFVNQNGSKLTSRALQYRVDYSSKSMLGFHVNPHMLRHTCATHLLEASGDIKLVQDILGHSSLTSTQIYTHLDIEYLHSMYQQYHPSEQ